MKPAGGFDATIQDLSYALRTFRRNRGFVLAAVLSLALGIGGNTAIFTVIRAVLLKPLPYQDPDRIVRLSIDNARLRVTDVGFSQVRFDELKPRAQSFSGLGAFFIAREDMTLAGGPGALPESIKVARVSSNFLRILGVEPSLGRGFLEEEDAPGARAAVIISADLWKRRFASDPLIAGKTATLNSTPSTIVGVLPAGFAFPMPGLDAWVPRPAEYSGLPPQTWRTNGYLVGLARLKPGVSLAQARAESDVLTRQYAAAHPDDSNSIMRIVPLQEQLVANVRTMLWMLFGAVGFVLLIACANVASLQLARAASRSREFAVRAALGAPRSRIVRQLLTESLLLALGGGAAGVLLARWALTALLRTNALDLPRAGELRLDPAVLAFTIALSIAAGVLFGLYPSWNASRPDLADALRVSGAASQTSGERSAFGLDVRGVLVVAQVALAVVLLIGASLLLESFANLTAVDPGFRSANLLTMQIALPSSRYDPRKQAAFFEELVDRVKALPGVASAGVTRTLPMSARIATSVAIVEQPRPASKDRPQSQMQTVSPDYFQALGIPLRRGRVFDDRDRPEFHAAPAIVNESFARRFWPAYPRGQNPIGMHVLLGSGTQPWEIVGIVADVHERNLDVNAIPEVYLPVALNPVSTAALVVRTHGDPHTLVNSIRAQVSALDRDQAVSNVKTMEEIIGDSIGQRRLTLVLLASFAAAALLLAIVGIYGVVAYSVAQRTREFGIRRALGAPDADIVKQVIGHSLLLALAGVAIGAGAAFALTRVMTGLLFHVRPTDPAIFLGIALVFLAVAAGSGYLPARRATRIDPLAALR